MDRGYQWVVLVLVLGAGEFVLDGSLRPVNCSSLAGEEECEGERWSFDGDGALGPAILVDLSATGWLKRRQGLPGLTLGEPLQLCGTYRMLSWLAFEGNLRVVLSSKARKWCGCKDDVRIRMAL